MAQRKEVSFSEVTSKFLEAAHALICREAGIETLFTVDGDAVKETDLGYGPSLMPVFVWYADTLHQRATGYSFGFGYRRDSNSLTSFVANVEMCTEANSEVLLYLVEALNDCRINLPKSETTPGAVALDLLIVAFQQDMESKIAQKVEQMPQPSATTGLQA